MLFYFFNKRRWKIQRLVREKFIQKRFLGGFRCKGYYAYSIKGILTRKGLNKGRPNKDYLKNAGKFANNLKRKL